MATITLLQGRRSSLLVFLRRQQFSYNQAIAAAGAAVSLTLGEPTKWFGAYDVEAGNPSHHAYMGWGHPVIFWGVPGGSTLYKRHLAAYYPASKPVGDDPIIVQVFVDWRGSDWTFTAPVFPGAVIVQTPQTWTISGDDMLPEHYEQYVNETRKATWTVNEAKAFEEGFWSAPRYITDKAIQGAGYVTEKVTEQVIHNVGTALEIPIFAKLAIVGIGVALLMSSLRNRR